MFKFSEIHKHKMRFLKIYFLSLFIPYNLFPNIENISMSFNYDEGSDDLGVWVQTINYPAMNGNPAATITQTWVNWSATGKSSGNTITIPVHISFEWADGKIVRECHKFDTTAMMAEIELASQG